MSYELKMTFDTKEELIAFLGGKPTVKEDGVKQVAQTLNNAVQQTLSAPQPVAPQQPVTPQPVSQTITQPVQQPAKQYTKDELAQALAPLMDQPEGPQMLQELLASYGAVSLHDLDKSMYSDFVTKLQNLGVSV